MSKIFVLNVEKFVELLATRLVNYYNIKMKAAVVTLFVLLACASADNLRGKEELQGSDCIDSIVAFGKDAYAVINDIKTLAGGDTSVIPTLISDGKAAIAAF